MVGTPLTQETMVTFSRFRFGSYGCGTLPQYWRTSLPRPGQAVCKPSHHGRRQAPASSILVIANMVLVLRDARPLKKCDNPMQSAEVNANEFDTHGIDITATSPSRSTATRD